MTSDLQKSKLRLTSVPLNEIGCNSSDLTEIRVKKCQQQQKSSCELSLTQENLEDSEREKSKHII